MRVTLADVKRTLATLVTLCEAYDAWDRFQHGEALKKLRLVEKNANDLRVALGDGPAGAFALSELPPIVTISRN